MDNCVFCKIIRKEIPSKPVFETQDVIVLKDINPQAPTHLLVIPKKHVESLVHLDDQTETISKMFEALLRLVRDQGLDQAGFRTTINTGEGGGQTVFHLHMHILSGRAMSGNLG